MLPSAINAFHSNAAFTWANQGAKITTHAVFFNDERNAGIFAQADCLVRAVFTGGVAKLTFNAFFFVNFSFYILLKVQVFPMYHVRNCFANDLIHAGKSFFIQVII